MGLFDSARSTSTTQTSNKYTAEQQALLSALTQQAGKGLGTGAEIYAGDMWAGVNPYEVDFLQGDSPNQQYREAAVRSALSGAPAYEVNDQSTQEYWDKYLKPQVDTQQRALNEQYAPGIFSGGRDIAQGQFNTGVLGEYANLAYKDEQARRQALTEAANRQANVAPYAWANNAEYESKAAALARDIEEKKITSNYQRWMSGEPDPVTGVVNQSANPYRALAEQLLGISPYVYQQNVNSQGAGLGYGALSGLASGVGSAAASALPSLISSVPEAWKAVQNSDWYNSMFGPENAYDPWGEIGGDYSDLVIDNNNPNVAQDAWNYDMY